MKKVSLSKTSMFGKQLMATVSVMIVLLILGVFATIAVSAGQFSNSLKSRMGFTVVMSDAVTDTKLNDLQKALATAPYTNSVSLITADEKMAQWEQDNGENVIEVLGVNPFGAEFEVTVKPDYAVTDSLNNIVAALSSVDGIDEISTTTQVVDVVNRVVDLFSMVFLPLALALLLVSGVLINNTVRLTVYSSRFLIHTMKLVGATGEFIRRPFIRTGIMNGAVAGIASTVILWGLVTGVKSAVPDLEQFTSWSTLMWIFPAMILAGIAICGIAAALATNKYLRLNYDEMF